MKQSLVVDDGCLRRDPLTIVIVLRVDWIPTNVQYVDEIDCITTNVPSWPIQVRKLDSREASELKNP